MNFREELMQIKFENGEGAALGEVSAEGFFPVERKMWEESGNILGIRTFVPIREVTALWHPLLDRMPEQKLPWTTVFGCGGIKGFPLLVFLDQKARCVSAVGLTDMMDDCRVSVKMNQASCGYEVAFTLAVCKETEDWEIFALTPSPEKRPPLAEVIDQYRKKVLSQIPEYPAGAWESVYCTWYAAHAALSDDFMVRNAEEARKLGLGTFIVDDGWCLDESKKVTPETLPDWYRDIGDWEWSEKKLPRLKEDIEKIQALGLSCMFWVAPFFCGRRSKLAGKATKFLTELHEGQRVYDPLDVSAEKCVSENILRFFREMKLDGLKIDFVDIIPPDPEKPRCRAAWNCIHDLTEKAKAYRKDALIEFRQNYATPLMAPVATAFRAGDVPFDYMSNFSRCVQIRLQMGDGVPVHSDPVYFHPEESAEAVARHMIAALAGVPMVSMELSTLKEEQKKVIAGYLAFYKENRPVLNFGHWDFDFRNNFPVSAFCTQGRKRIVILTDIDALPGALKKFSGRVTLLNMTTDMLVQPLAVGFDALGRSCGNRIPPGGRGIFSC